MKKQREIRLSDEERVQKAESRQEFRLIDKELEQKFHRQLVLLAKLASIPSLKALDRAAKTQLIEEAQSAGVGGLLGRFTTPRTVDGKAKRALGADRVPLAWVAIWRAYPLARKHIRALLDGETLPLPSLSKEVRLDSKRFGVPVVLAADMNKERENELLESLHRSLTLFPFPYHPCPGCSSGIFAQAPKQRGRKQEYCSTKCRSRKYEAERKDDPGRKAAVLKNMGTYRKNLKKKQAEEKQPVVTLRGTPLRKGEQS